MQPAPQHHSTEGAAGRFMRCAHIARPEHTSHAPAMLSSAPQVVSEKRSMPPFVQGLFLTKRLPTQGLHFVKRQGVLVLGEPFPLRALPAKHKHKTQEATESNAPLLKELYITRFPH